MTQDAERGSLVGAGPELRKYTILVLGPSGSGKTVYLASLYARLSVQQAGTLFWLNTDRQRQVDLNGLYAQVADPDAKWPLSTTHDTTETWPFTCCVTGSDGHNYEIMQFEYLDYAGEFLTELQENPEARAFQMFERDLARADVLLAFLDGRRLLELMRGAAAPAKYLFTELKNTLDVIQRSTTPAHFVITKWDLFDDSEYDLRAVRDWLMRYPPFRGIVEQRPPSTSSQSSPSGRTLEATTRLIPVSSVGTGFATLDEHGDMVKRPGATSEPFQVEMPFACILPDAFGAHFRALKASEQARIIRAERPDPQLGLLDQLRLWLASLLRGTEPVISHIGLPIPGVPLPLPLQITKDDVDRLIRHLERAPKSKDERADAEFEYRKALEQQSREVVQSEQEAVQRTIRNFLTLIERLEYDFPESNLATR